MGTTRLLCTGTRSPFVLSIYSRSPAWSGCPVPKCSDTLWRFPSCKRTEREWQFMRNVDLMYPSLMYPSVKTSQTAATDMLATVSQGTMSDILVWSPIIVRKTPFPAPAMKATPPFWTFSTQPGIGSFMVPKTVMGVIYYMYNYNPFCIYSPTEGLITATGTDIRLLYR